MSDKLDSYKGYKVDSLKELFDAACDADDWKAPISVWVSGEGVLPVVAAIKFYTATEPKVSLNTDKMRCMVGHGIK